MPAKEHLLRRGNVFYFRMRFPRELLRAGASVIVNGKPQKHEVKFSLQTSDYKTACGRVATHTAIWTAELEKRRQNLKLGRGLERARQIVATGGNNEIATSCNHEPMGAAELMSDERIRAIIVRSFIENQRHSAEIIEGTRGEPWSLRMVETYWEFSHETAPEFINMLEAGMRSYSALPFVREEFAASRRRSRRTVEREERNAASLTVTAAPGIKIIIYAKTNKRIRFEVRHTLRELRTGSGLPMQARGVAGMVEALQRFAVDAAEVLNTFLTHLERDLVNPVVPWSPSPTDFLFKVVERCESREAARVIMGLLLTEGAVSRVPWLNPSIDALRRSRVLERAANQQRTQSVTFLPTPAYQHALRCLREVSDANRLTVERRQRTRPR